MPTPTFDSDPETFEVPDGTVVVTATIISADQDVAAVQTMAGERLHVPVTEWPFRRPWRRGHRLVALRIEPPRGRPQLSLTHPALVAMAADGLVPELRDGRIRVMGVARVAGARSKLAVAPTVEDLDAVAACVGRGANRIRSLVALLGGERVDVVGWDSDPLRLVANAMAPAAVSAVRQDGDTGLVEVVVPRHQMAAAVGEGGLNSQLAGRLAGVDVFVVPG